mgnify:FL=1
MFSTKQGHFWYHFYNIFGMTQTLTGGLNLGPPALEASTIPLGYRGGSGFALPLTNTTSINILNIIYNINISVYCAACVWFTQDLF